MFERIKGGRKDQTSRALVAVAQHMVEAMVSMLKRGEPWRAEEDQRPDAGPSVPSAAAA